MNLIIKSLTFAAATCIAFSAHAKSIPIIEIDEEWMPVCYNGDAESALEALVSLDFDPAISSEDAEIVDGVLKAVQYDEAGEVQQLFSVPMCEGNTGEELIDTEGDYNPSITFSCFETMSNINSLSQPISKSASAETLAMIARAEADAVKRVKGINKGVTPVSTVRMDGDVLLGVKVSFTRSDDDEYGDYFLYSVDGYSKVPRLELLSAHYGDDQGPTMNIYCTGWSEGKVIK